MQTTGLMKPSQIQTELFLQLKLQMSFTTKTWTAFFPFVY